MESLDQSGLLVWEHHSPHLPSSFPLPRPTEAQILVMTTGKSLTVQELPMSFCLFVFVCFLFIFWREDTLALTDAPWTSDMLKYLEAVFC